MRFRSFLHVVLVLCGVAFAAPAFAQDSVSVRTGEHTGYSRIVFEWKDKLAYSLSKDGGRLLLRFSKAATLGSKGFEPVKNISALEMLSQASEPLQVAVSIPAGSRFRDFIVVNKVIVDVYDADDGGAAAPVKEPVKQEGKKAPPVKAEEKKEPAKAEAAPTPAQETKPEAESEPPPAQDATPKGDFTRKPAESAAPAPIGAVESAPVPAPAFDAHVITLTTTTSVSMAVYERSGELYIVTDSKDPNIAPQLTGPQKNRFPPIRKVEKGPADGSVYHIELPDGMSAHGEGGGLSWRIVLSAKPRGAKASEARADGGKLVWPLKNMRKTIGFTDPLVGDKVSVVTAGTADQFSGAGRNFVNLQTLSSVVGLAFIGKTDDLKTTVGLSDVSVESPQGLSVSSSESLRSDHIRQSVDAGRKEDPAKEDDTKKEEKLDDLSLTEDAPATPVEGTPEEHPAATKEDMARAASEKPSGNNIYNFPSWEMGGLQALDKNIHVLMMEVANKPEESRAEDIITMAKLLVANDRGPEALGMLRIALQNVPELDQNAEFQALRGAALALSGKYDEAFNDFTRENLQKYDDVKFWLAYILGGLEDWKQAGEVMPASMSAIASYPQAIRTPLAVMFAEIALRNGRGAQAEQILGLLEPDLPTLPLAWASAWGYLSGEAQRQRGEFDKATEYWEPLVKDGKDDLYRAKAGLSLTKLQIDQKKLKAADAVDRLEGLRYAWRGDELETLINYRLGQMYIENKEYLKGLSVLRNATTLTPGLQVGKDVRKYMTDSFRDIFINDRLKNISPLDAIGIYEEFKDLSPPGEEGYKFADKLAERLVDADLLGRAASLLEYQVNNRLQGDKKAEVAIRLAAIRLLDGNPDGALRSLEIAQDTLNKIDGVAPAAAAAATTQKPQDVAPQAGEEAKTAAPAKTDAPPPQKADPEKQRQIFLLKARALSMKKKPDEAIAILDKMAPDADVNRLRTDIAWVSGKWEEAAMSLSDLIMAEDISPRRPLTEYQRDLILNRAISLNLSGNRVALANLRERFNTQMKDTAKGQMFEVITRPRRPDMIGSREAIESMISEIDLFKGFLDGYAKITDPQAKAPEPDAPKEPVPVDGTAQPQGAAPAVQDSKPAEDAKAE